jgi:opacity protein-like surface antigen
MKAFTTAVTVALTLATAAVTTNANAQNNSGFYGEVGYTSVQYKGSGVKADMGMLGATLGYEINSYLAVEGMYATGISGDTVKILNVDVNFDIDHNYGVFLKPKYAVSKDLELFAKLGWNELKGTLSAVGRSASSSDDSFAYGIGAKYAINPKMYVTGGYSSLYDKNSTTTTGWNFGLGYKF